MATARGGGEGGGSPLPKAAHRAGGALGHPGPHLGARCPSQQDRGGGRARGAPDQAPSPGALAACPWIPVH